MGPGQKLLTRDWSGQPPLVWGWKISCKNPKFFKFCTSGQKVPRSETGWPLIYCGSKVCSGQVG